MAIDRGEMLRQRMAEEAAKVKAGQAYMQTGAVDQAKQRAAERLASARAASAAARPSPVLTAPPPGAAPPLTTSLGAGVPPGAAPPPPPPPPGTAPPPPPGATPPIGGASPSPIYGATAPNPTARAPFALRAGEAIGRGARAATLIGDAAASIPGRLLGGAGMMLYSPALGGGQDTIDPGDLLARLPDRSRSPEGAGGFSLPGFYRPPISSPAATPATPPAAAPTESSKPPATVAGIAGGLPEDFTLGKVYRTEPAPGMTRAQIGTEGGTGALEAPTGAFAKEPGTFNVLKNAAATVGGPMGARFDAKTGQLTGGLDMDLSAAKQFAAQRGQGGWQALEDAGVISKRPRGEQVTLIRETPDAVPSWRQPLANLKGMNRAERQSAIAAAELASRDADREAARENAAQMLGLEREKFGYQQKTGAAAAALEREKLANELQKAAITAGKPTDLMANFEAFRQQFPNVDPMTLLAGLTRNLSVDETTGEPVNRMAPAAALTAPPAAAPPTIKSAQEAEQYRQSGGGVVGDDGLGYRPRAQVPQGPTPAEVAEAEAERSKQLTAKQKKKLESYVM